MAGWSIEGTYMEACNCEAICPCLVLGAPTSGECIAIVGWRIERGRDGDVPLGGLNVALAVNVKGNMKDGGWTVALYVDDRADEAQQGSLERIFSGSAGGHFASLVPLIGTFLGSARVPIRFEGSGRRYRLELGRIGSAEIEAIAGQEGGPVTLTGHPLAVVPGTPLTAARSTQFRFDDHGIRCELASRNGLFSPFAYHA